MLRRILSLASFAVLVCLPASAAKEYSHQKFFKTYEGTKTCLKCHKSEAESFFHSQHYQWQGESPGIVNSDGQRLGKMNTINDFCTNPMPSWIGMPKNSRGDVVSNGCSKCHAGLGKVPTQEMSQEQLENIDCLICHAKGYRRALYEDEDGGFAWKPILWKNQEGMDSVSKRVVRPERTMCLRCHSASGGGPNFKRGDIEYALAEPEVDFDFHMSPDGADLHCVDCHAGEDHRVRGRGTDLSGTDSPDQLLSCDDGGCHDSEPHAKELLNRHAQRVFCTTCHIPTFAKEDATDMVRDWSTPKYNEELDKYGGTITLESNVEPVVAWYNGTTWAQLPGVPVTRMDDGAVGMMIPKGSKDDPASRLYAFKLHRGKLPVVKDTQWLLPIAVEEFFANGNIEEAVVEAAEKMYGLHHPEYEWVDTVRYMGIFHEVVPADDALGCLDCHGADGRLDWAGLGYEADPLADCLEPSHE